jgi:hypothetical protein
MDVKKKNQSTVKEKPIQEEQGKIRYEGEEKRR